MKDKLRYISHFLFVVGLIYIIIDLLICLYRCHSGSLPMDPLGVPFSYLWIVICIILLLLEYLIILKKKENISFVLAIIFSCIGINYFLMFFITALAVSGVIRPTAGETTERLLESVFGFLILTFLAITHYATYRKLKNDKPIQILDPEKTS
jgi:hypothetical protein